MDQALRELLTRRLVRHVYYSSMEAEDEFAFSHWMVRDVIYRQLPREVRATKHAIVARWMEAKAGTRADAQAEVLARHYAAAAELARAAGAGELAESLREPALHYLSGGGGPRHAPGCHGGAGPF